MAPQKCRSRTLYATSGETIQTAHVENKVWQQELHWALLQYRSTPHSMTQVPPAELLFNRTVRGKLPVLHPRELINKHKLAQANDTESSVLNRAPSTWETQFS